MHGAAANASTWPPDVGAVRYVGSMVNSTSPGGFDEAQHPRGQPDNPGKFKGKPIPAPPSPGRRRPPPTLSTPTSEIPLAVYDALVVVADWLRDTAQDGPRDTLLSMRIEGHGEPLSVAGHLTRLRPTEERDSPGAMLPFPKEWLQAPLRPTEERDLAYGDGAAPSNAREVVLQRVYGAEFVEGADWRCVDCGDRTDLRVWHIVPAYRDKHPDAWSAKCVGCALWGGGLQDSVWPG